MSERSHDSAFLTRYLLGKLPDAEQDRLEQDYFLDNELFHELLDARDQLTSDYLNGRLSQSDREQFERRFLATPDGRRDVELDWFFQSPPARNSLIQRPQPQAATPPGRQTGLAWMRAPWVGWAAATALLVIACAVLWPILRTEPVVPVVEVAQPRPQVAVGQEIFRLSLKARQYRDLGQDTPKAQVGTGTRVVELRLELEGKTYPSYQASLQRKDRGNAEVMTADSLKPDAPKTRPATLTWAVPAERLPIGDYKVILTGITADNFPGESSDYHFWVRTPETAATK